MCVENNKDRHDHKGNEDINPPFHNTELSVDLQFKFLEPESFVAGPTTVCIVANSFHSHQQYALKTEPKVEPRQSVGLVADGDGLVKVCCSDVTLKLSS